MTSTHVEKRLTRDEVEGRHEQLVQLFSSQESLSAEIDGYRRDLRAARRQLRELDTRVRVVSREIRSGVVLIPRQQALPDPGIDAMTDEPAPEVDPPRVPTLDVFAKLYPCARDAPELRAALRTLLTEAQRTTLEAFPLVTGTPAFDAIAHWARTERARLDGPERAQRGEPGIAGLYIPTCRMPQELVAALKQKKPKKQRGVRPLTSKGKKK